MDHERIARITQEKDRRIRKNEAEKAKEQQRLDKKKQRISERLAPYRELEKRNKAIYDRVNRLVSIKGPVAKPEPINPARSVQHHVYVVVGPTETTSATPNHMTVASVQTDEWKYNGEDKKRATIKFLAVPKEMSEEMGRELQPTGMIRENHIELGQENTYDIGAYVYNMRSVDISGRRFSPVKGLMKIFEVREIDDRLSDLESSMAIIEQAAHMEAINSALYAAIRDRDTAAV